MSTHRLTITIPQPCHEDWSAMTPELQGRFCGSCQKTVVDFTAMSDAEVVNWLGKEHTCGRFRSNQLDRELTAFSVPQRKWAWRSALLGLFAWFSTKTAEAQTIKKGEITPVTSNTSIPSPATDIQANLSSFKGVVLDSVTLAPISGASIHIAGTSITASSNAQGQFELIVPTSMTDAKNTSPLVTFYYIGMMSEKRRLDELMANLPNKIFLRPQNPKKIVSITLGMPTLRPTPTKKD